MNADTLGLRGASHILVVALALTLASCIKSTHKIGGTVSGMTGTGLVLQNNGGDNLSVAANGAFTFPTALKKDASYSVTVFVQPTGQTCTVSNGSGTVRSTVTDVRVSCTGSAPTAFSVGGNVSGLAGNGLVLQNNGGNDLPISVDGGFTFSTLIANGAAYAVTVRTQPTGQACTVANGNGNIAGVNVSNVALSCFVPPAAPSVNALGFGLKEVQLSWTAASGATFYRVLENPDGASAYSVAANNITATSYNLTVPVHRRLNASYKVEACNAAGCAASAPQSLTTDDLKSMIGYVKASNTGAGDQFGFSVAVSGDGNTLAVGAPNEDSSLNGVTAGSVPAAGDSATDAGAVYVFARVSGVWTQEAYVKASNTAAGDAFGYAVALSSDGNTLAVGAHSQGGNGSAYVFVRSAGAWTQQGLPLKASNPGAGDRFGSSVALSGDGNTLAVGAPMEDGSGTGIDSANDNSADDAGAAYVFTRSGASWSQQAYVKASNTETSTLFGTAVALNGDGNTLAVGAQFENSPATGINGDQTNDCSGAGASCAMFSGAAYVFTRSGASWSQQAYVKASNTAMFDMFGSAVSLSGDGDTLAVGAPQPLTGSDPGAAYVYTRSANAWSEQALVHASNAGANDQFGSSVALSGDGNTLAVGAPFEDSSGSGIGSTPDDAASDAGAAYFYARGGASWSEKSFVKASNTTPLEADRFGWSVALSSDGSTLAVGASFEDGAGTGINNPGADNAASAGAVYLY